MWGNLAPLLTLCDPVYAQELCQRSLSDRLPEGSEMYVALRSRKHGGSFLPMAATTLCIELNAT
jgi:hypothetical protein